MLILSLKDSMGVYIFNSLYNPVGCSLIENDFINVYLISLIYNDSWACYVCCAFQL